MDLSFSFIMNVAFYILIGFLTYRLIIVYDDDGKRISHDQMKHYRGFTIGMCFIWPIIFLIICFNEAFGEENEAEKEQL